MKSLPAVRWPLILAANRVDLSAQFADGRARFSRNLPPVRFNRNRALIPNLLQCSEKRPKIVTGHARRRALGGFSNVDVAEPVAVLQNVVGRLAIAEHMEDIRQYLNVRMIALGRERGGFRD